VLDASVLTSDAGSKYTMIELFGTLLYFMKQNLSCEFPL